MKFRLRAIFSRYLDALLTFFDLRRHYPGDYSFFDSFISKPTNFSYLIGVPSQTSIRERLYLYNLFRYQWLGGGVVEVGPFLGGTTRAIGLGMLDSKFSRGANKKLLTIDEFNNYMTLNQLLQMGVTELFDSKSLDLSEQIPFKSIFENYSLNQVYSHLLEPKSFRIPEFSDQFFCTDTYRDILKFCASNKPIEIIFVDGAKSYYSLYFLLEMLISSIDSGTRIIFQDYLKVSCWWIPLIMGSLDQIFKVEAVIDSTVTFICVDHQELVRNFKNLVPSEISHVSSTQILNSFNSEVAKTISGYSKRLRSISMNQERAALHGSGSDVDWRESSNLKNALRIFPRTFSHIKMSREVSSGKHDER